MKISTFMVGLLLVGMFTTLLGIFYADIGTQYSIDYNDTQFAGYDQLASINNDLSSINTTLTDLNQETGVVDLLGGFLASGFDVIKITFNSFSAFWSMSETAFSTQVLGSSVSVFKTYLVAITMVLFFFAVVAVLVGRDV